jgi:hypothetical protein
MKRRRELIRECWGKDFIDHGAEVFFVVSGDKARNTSERIKDVLYTPGTNTHGDLTNRMCWLWRHLGGLSYTHVLVIDDDCSVNVPLFMTLGWRDADAWGHNSGGYLSGCAAVYSCAAVKKLAFNMPRDDMVVGSLLRHLGFELTHAGQPCPVRPWRPTTPNIGEEWGFGGPNVAIQHYVATEDIKNNHLKLKNKNGK